jgi:hypothetical protein
MNRKLREVTTANGGSIAGEEYFPLEHTDYGATIDNILSSGAEVVFNTIVPPGLAPCIEQLHMSGFMKRGGHLVCTYFEENFLSFLPPEQVEGLYSCLDYYQGVSDPFSKELLNQYDKLYPGGAKFTAGSASTGMYRGLKLWEAAVREAGSLKQDDVIKALDHAKIPEGPGGPAEMVASQHHVRMNMYIAQAKSGKFEIVKTLGIMDPKECMQGTSERPRSQGLTFEGALLAPALHGYAVKGAHCTGRVCPVLAMHKHRTACRADSAEHAAARLVLGSEELEEKPLALRTDEKHEDHGAGGPCPCAAELRTLPR